MRVAAALLLSGTLSLAGDAAGRPWHAGEYPLPTTPCCSGNLAGGSGRLIADPASHCLWVGQRHPMLWIDVYRARFAGGRAELVDLDGDVVAEEGDVLTFGMGWGEATPDRCAGTPWGEPPADRAVIMGTPVVNCTGLQAAGHPLDAPCQRALDPMP